MADAAGPKPPLLECRRSDFALPPDLHYLNCAYMGPLPVRAQEAGVAGVRAKAAPTAIEPADFFRDSDEARALFAQIIGARDPERVAIVPSVSYGIATVARNVHCTAGDSIVIAAEQFPSNVYAWRRLAAATGAAMRVVGPRSDSARGESWTEALLDAIDERCAVVALPHVHWTDGTRFDLERIAEKTRAAGAALVIDGTQSIGAMPFDFERIRPDALICAGYKWLLGPYGIGFAWLGERFDDGVPLEETWIGREHSEDFQHLIDYRDTYQPGAARFDVGERSNFILLPMVIESMRLVLDWGADNIQRYCDRLCAGVLEEAATLGFRVEASQWRGAHLYGLRWPPGMDQGILGTALRTRNVFASLRGSALRVSPNMYNDADDVNALLDALRADSQTPGSSGPPSKRADGSPTAPSSNVAAPASSNVAAPPSSNVAAPANGGGERAASSPER
ncbi:MAG: aminotransferase class V-fold PLP-dependent enzyme [Gemmatimonadetes bacterium]|nr:aminotransferase class V-fold PLP-dependent enzyme [Gemmatimonadota bacterium]